MDDRQTLRAILRLLGTMNSKQLRLVYLFLRGLTAQ